ncbi:hypothetical protein F2Q69_00033338 [Brassica cretica]|uniref:Lipoyl-binding domain-containing protein n=1 Tax=Brassica cretica TaxID=69181 RepID=A0A8S9SNC1_BRACR|nr:hypothetical protein F2Q69_00033338 [Brassica cretica]
MASERARPSVTEVETEEGNSLESSEVNTSPYEEGWIIKVELSDAGEEVEGRELRLNMASERARPSVTEVETEEGNSLESSEVLSTIST